MLESWLMMVKYKYNLHDLELKIREQWSQEDFLNYMKNIMKFMGIFKE